MNAPAFLVLAVMSASEQTPFLTDAAPQHGFIRRTHCRDAGRFLVAVLFMLGWCALPASAVTWDHVTWPPPTSTADVGATVPVSATVTVSPPTITLNFIVAGKYQIFRKAPAANTWGAALTTLPSAATSWTDTNVQVGQLYEYKVIYTDGPSELQVPKPITYVGGNSPSIGYIMTGMNVDETQPRGRVIVVVATDVPAQLPADYAQYLADLQADGWFVHVIPVAPAVSYDVAGANALATVTVTAGGTGYVSGTTGTTDASGDIRLTNASGSMALGTMTVASGVVTAVSVVYGGGGFTAGESLTVSNVKAGTGTGIMVTANAVTSGTTNPIPIRNSIMAIYDQYPGEVKNVILLGKVPACRTGASNIGDPDGHQVNNAGWGADGYYANMTGTWTDTGSNIQYLGNSGITIASGCLNVPGDNKFDQYFMWQTGGQADMGFGRIDLANNIAGQYEALKFYLRKLHRYRTASPDFQPGRRIVLRTGAFPNIDETCWTMAYGVTGSKTMIDCISSAELPTEISASFDADADYSGSHGPYLFYYKGNGGPGIGVGGKAVFWTGMQSHWGWWFSSTVSSGENAEALRLGEDSYGLSWTWDIFGTRYFYHRMAMGFDAGDMIRISINNTDSVNGTYAFTTDTNGFSYIAPCAGGLFMNHIGDPTLRFFMFAPPTNLSVVASGGKPSLTWTASTEPTVLGYHIYRAPMIAGNVTAPYVRITSDLIVSPNYTDTDATAGTGTGQWSYMVRGVRLETTGSGTYFNASLGAIQSLDQNNPPPALAISTAGTLPHANWNTAYVSVLTATGATLNYGWTLLSGSLPPGLSLNENGTFSGLPTKSGTYAFTAQVTDALGQTAQQAFSLTADSGNILTLLPVATAYTISTSPTRVQGPTEVITVSPSNYSFLRFNIAGLNTNNTLVSAKLRLYAAPGTTNNSIVLLQAGLTQDAGVNWSMATLCWNNQPTDNPAVPPAIALTYPVPLNYVDLDVTQELAYALANNTTGSFGVRLFSQSTQTVVLCSGYSYGGAIPQLIIQTSNAPKITITSPAVNPAAVFTGSGLALTATVTAIPANFANLTVQWTQVSGPGSTTFSSPTTPNTTATFSAAGDYVLQLAASDGVLQSSQTLTVRVMNVPVNGPIDSLLLRLPFNESSGTTTADATGGGNNGTLISGATFSPSGIVGNALLTSGSNQMVNIADSVSNPNPVDNQQALSISMWFNAAALDTDSSFRNLITKTGAFTLQIRGVSTGGQIFSSIAGATSQQSAHRIAAGTWNNIIAVFNGAVTTNNLQLYINGVPDIVSSIVQTSVPRKATSPLVIGAASTSDVHAFNGLMDEVRIYRRVLTLAEIQDIAAGVPANLGPVINTSPGISGTAGQALAVSATVTDDGKPTGTLVYSWNQLTGPSPLTFANPGSLSTSATPTAAGTFGLQFTASDGVITTFANVAATIAAPVGIAGWRLTYFGTTDAGGTHADTANPTGDGLMNLLKYALGLNPNTSYALGTAGLGFQVHNAGGQSYLTYTFTGTVSDVTYIVEATSDLNGAWTLLYLHSGSVPGTPTVQDTPVTGNRFIRLRVTNP